MMSSKKLTSILLIASILISTSVQVSAINTQQTVAEESTLATIENNSEETTSVNRWENPTENMTTVEERATEIVLKKDSNKTTQQESQTTIDKVTVKSIVTSTKSLVLENGESRKLTIETDPLDIDKDTLTWQSTNNTIAEADKDGNIIAKGVGSCTIKVYADDGSDVYGYCAVTVTQKVQNFAFKDAPRTMEIGEQITVATNIIPLSATNKILRWTSSDKTVATVSQKGTVTAVGNGKCTITAKTIDGSEVIKSFEVECSGKVAPVEEKIKVTSVSAVAIRKIIKENTSFKMETTVSPSNASNKTLTYTTSNSKVATVDENGNVNAVGKGNCVIYASTKDGSNLRTGCVVTVEENAQSVQFTRKSVVCRVDETVDLKPKSVPDGTTLPDVVYRSTNPNVVTVDKNGVITTLAKGSCQIICISADGMKVYDKSSIV
ncbi:MAG: Ig domain-containing protein, partial [Clostridia bacterium]|nr:Ig domain-containing protein [Clostridia bacterium]